MEFSKEKGQIHQTTGDNYPTEEIISEAINRLGQSVGRFALNNTEISRHELSSIHNPEVISDNRLTILWHRGATGGSCSRD